MKKFFGLLTILLMPLLAFGQENAEIAEDVKIPVVLEMFHGDGCPHCANQFAFLPVLEVMYPDMKLEEYEVWKNPENQKKMVERLKELDTEPRGVPTNIINNEIVQGFNRNGLVRAFEKHFGAPVIDLDKAIEIAAYDPTEKAEHSNEDGENEGASSDIDAELETELEEKNTKGIYMALGVSAVVILLLILGFRGKND